MGRNRIIQSLLHGTQREQFAFMCISRLARDDVRLENLFLFFLLFYDMRQDILVRLIFIEKEENFPPVKICSVVLSLETFQTPPISY